MLNIKQQEPIPKIDRIYLIVKIDNTVHCCNHHENKNKPAITNIQHKLWDMMIDLLSTENPNNTIVGRPVIPLEKC